MNHKDTEIVINLSLDGLEQTHNAVRKNEQSWDKVWEAYEELKKINFIKVRFITVVHEDNYNEIIPLMKKVKSIDLKSIYDETKGNFNIILKKNL